VAGVLRLKPDPWTEGAWVAIQYPESVPMQSLTPPLSASWLARARDLLFRLLRGSSRDREGHVVWVEMKPIDFEGEDTSLTETDLRRLK